MEENYLYLQMIQPKYRKSYPPTELINEFSKVAGYNINKQKSIVFLCITNEQSENKI